MKEIADLIESLNKDDVGQKRYLMYKVFDIVLEKTYTLEGRDLPDEELRVRDLQKFDGYLYKLAQEFLTSSSTMEKEKKLEKMVEHLTRNMEEPSPEWETDKETFQD